MNFPIVLHETDLVRLTVLPATIQVIQVSLESLYNHKLYGSTHLLNWKYIRLSKKLFTVNPSLERVFDRVFKYPDVLFLIGLRLVVALVICIGLLENRVYPAAIVLLCFLGLMTSLRNTHSDNGSDQLVNIVLISISIIYLTGNTGFTRGISILFIACQGVLAYWTAGFLKVIEPGWRNGAHLRDVMSTRIYGNRFLKRALDRFIPGYRIASLLLVSWEMAMGLAIFLPPNICLIILAGGIVFHFLVALIMGFNTFFWAFLATYPSIYFISFKFH